MTNAAYADLVIDQGADFAVQLYWTDYNNNPFTVLSPMRMDMKAATGQIVATLNTNDDANDLETPSIVYNSDSGLIQLQLPPSVTSTIAPGDYSYDLFVTYQDQLSNSSTRLAKILYGRVFVNGRVTKNV